MSPLVNALMWKEHEFRLILGRTRIDFDPTKEDSNRRKHGYSLTCAVDIFENALLLQNAFITSEPFMENGEVRYMHLSEYQGRVVLIVTTMREEETVRVISMRDAHENERRIFVNNTPGFML
jgi:uncharacterized DUF497 family protein